MNDQKILDSKPPKQGNWPDCNQVDSDGKWSHRQPIIRSLADIEELVKLRKANAELVAKLAGSEYTVNLLAVKSKELIDGLDKDRNKFKALAFLITPEVIDLVRCGIGGNYSGNRYIEKMEKTHAPILSMLQALKVGV
jgi:hypothetical protein